MMAGNLSGQMQASGAGAALTSQDPGNASSAISRYQSTMPTMALANAHSYTQHGTAGIFNQGNQLQTALRTTHHFGDVGSAVQNMSNANSLQNVSHSEWGRNITPTQAAMLGRQRAWMETGKAESQEQFKTKFMSDYMQSHPGASISEASSKAGEFMGYFHSPALASRALGAVGPDGIDRFLKAGGIQETRNIATQEAFAQVASNFGGVEKLQRAFETKDSTERATAVRQYMALTGIKDFNEASRELGETLGIVTGANAAGLKQGLDTVGPEGVVSSATTNMVDNAARAQVSMDFAKTLARANGDDDYKGLYSALTDKHSAGYRTVLNTQEAVEAVNKKMAEQGKDTRFELGDTVTLSKTEDGGITLAKGDAGASRYDNDHSSSKIGVYEEGAMSIKQLEELSTTVAARGNGVLSKHINNAIKNMKGMGIKAAHVDTVETGGFGNQFATVSITASGKSMTENFNATRLGYNNLTSKMTEIQEGKKVWQGEQVRQGKSFTYENSRTVIEKDATEINVGTSYASGSAMQSVLSGETEKLLSAYLNPTISYKAKKAQRVALSMALATDLSHALSRMGVSQDYTRGNIGLNASAGTPPGTGSSASISGSGSIGGQRTDEKTTNLFAQQYEALLRSSEAQRLSR
ncbi:MAG: hypothetical protein RBT37_09635 [Dissulfurispiraceae bacterium]|jgi:phosphoglycolate phosphatase-like HAD superfamily hydrolase|nr:hypothetical protein [Dissulfurispiraceae bacterium]